MIERDYREKQRELEARQRKAERQAKGEPEPERSYDAPVPAGLTPRQRLEYANANFLKRGGWQEPPLTDDERGMSSWAFEQLPPEQRLKIANRVYFQRRST